MRRNVRWTVAVFVTAAFTLCGCIKTDLDVTVGRNEKMSGTVIVGFSAVLVRAGEQRKGDVIAQLRNHSGALPPGSRIEAFDSNGFIGQKITMNDVPVAGFRAVMDSFSNVAAAAGGASSSNDFFLARERDGWRFTGTIDLSSYPLRRPGGSTSSRQPQPAIRIRFTFPGRILRHDPAGRLSNGERTIEWKPHAGDTLMMEVVAARR